MGLAGLGVAAATLAVSSSIFRSEAMADAEGKPASVTSNDRVMSRFASRTRLRRANTNLTNLDSVILGYEYRLRETASLEKIFKYFSSVVLDGEEFMTPLDLGKF